ncbi:MAG: uroporphyrinogen decarboxylase family protein [Kiritimatiellae bacterium]|nr:uroporphyrinogen decarboxylase family protein [Kiritimatiellia bacterium]
MADLTLDTPMTPKQRMLNAYRGVANDRPAVAPELWYYYPAKLLGVDMIAFMREVPFHEALLKSFTHFDCEGWGVVFAGPPNDRVRESVREIRVDDDTLETRTTLRTPAGELTSAGRLSRDEPGWCTERPLKDLKRDLAAWEILAFGGEPEQTDMTAAIRAWKEVGDRYLLEFWLGVPFFDFWAGAREGGFETGIYDFLEPDLEPYLQRLRARYTERLVRLARTVCTLTPIESLCIGCSWSCNSLLGPELWRRWDMPVIRAVADEVHRHGRLLHIHFHGKCMETLRDFVDTGVDCVCPFERPPGGDVEGLEGLRRVHRELGERVTMNGNVHTVETLIRGTPEDVRREVVEIKTAFADSSRCIIGTGDQVGRETPEENLVAMVMEAKRT